MKHSYLYLSIFVFSLQQALYTQVPDHHEHLPTTTDIKPEKPLKRPDAYYPSDKEKDRSFGGDPVPVVTCKNEQETAYLQALLNDVYPQAIENARAMALHWGDKIDRYIEGTRTISTPDQVAPQLQKMIAQAQQDIQSAAVQTILFDSELSEVLAPHKRLLEQAFNPHIDAHTKKVMIGGFEGRLTTINIELNKDTCLQLPKKLAHDLVHQVLYAKRQWFGKPLGYHQTRKRIKKYLDSH